MNRPVADLHEMLLVKADYGSQIDGLTTELRVCPLTALTRIIDPLRHVY